MWKKRFAAILLWTLCLTSMLIMSVSTSAQATTAKTSGKSTALLTRGEWIHQLVNKFDLSVSKSDYPDNYYPDLSEDNTYYLYESAPTNVLVERIIILHGVRQRL